MLEAGWSARRVARRLGRSDCEKMLGPVDLRDVIYTNLLPTASSAAIQAQEAPSLGALVPSLTIQRRLAEGHLVSRLPLSVLPLTPTHRRLRYEWCCARRN
ncbi:transposable element Tcb2 transposase [Trichonephila clavipes]|nr:transposable element Tcb2 transposase [Trichonephila clavipes]